MTRLYREEQQIPMIEGYDVVVVGGGIAGVSAALAARRGGSKVLLIEKSVVLGGLATLGFVAIYLPLCDGKGVKYSTGIAEELLRLSIKYGYDTLPPEWKNGKGGEGVTSRYRTNFSPSEFILAMDELMEKEGVDILYDTVGCNMIMEGTVCKGLIVQNKSGRQAYMAKMFIDTTGDLEVMARAGVGFDTGDNWATYWAYTADLDSLKKAVEKKDVYEALNLKWLGAMWNGDCAPPEYSPYIGLEAWEVSKFIQDGRRLLRQEMEGSEGRERTVVSLPGMAQFRLGRQMHGYYTLKGEDVQTHFDDSIGCFTDFKHAGPIYEIPYRTLICPQMANVLTAGRSFSATGTAWVKGKIIPGCAVTGQAAGQAAAMAAQKNIAVNEVSVPDLQHALNQADVRIHF